jgi:hypothetical protein
VNHATIEQEILKELDRLPPELQRQVLEFTRSLTLSTPKGVPGQQLLRFAGVLNTEDAQAMTQVIEAECERVDSNAW